MPRYRIEFRSYNIGADRMPVPKAGMGERDLLHDPARGFGRALEEAEGARAWNAFA